MLMGIGKVEKQLLDRISNEILIKISVHHRNDLQNWFNIPLKAHSRDSGSYTSGQRGL